MAAKEGIVLDSDGNTLFAPPGTVPEGGMRARVRVYRGGWWLPIALGLGIPALFVMGIFIFTVLMTIGLIVMILRSLFSTSRQ